MSLAASARPVVRYRRPRHLVGGWSGDGLVLGTVDDRDPPTLEPLHLRILEAADVWASPEDIGDAVGSPPESVESDLAWMAERGLLLRSTDTESLIECRLPRWGPWAPLAAAFHFGTRGIEFVDPLEAPGALFVTADHPDPVKRYPGVERVDLPGFGRDGQLRRALRRRRTCRRWAPGTLDAGQLAELCGLTWGTQAWADVDGVPSQQLKTSPSGGARHSIEAYVGVLDVAGVDAGLYHYQPDRHALSRLDGAFDPERAAALLAGQRHFAGASVVVFMTSVIERVLWRYKHPRSYRQLWLEAGHLAQTFLLVATDLGLAAFSTNAFDDEAAEQALGIDGIDEILLYAVGAGIAADEEWRPFPSTHPGAVLRAPSYHERLGWADESSME